MPNMKLRWLKTCASAPLRGPFATRLGLFFGLRVGGLKQANDSPTHVLIAAPGRGNIGDQAMAQAFVENVGGSTLIVTRHPSDYTLAVPTVRFAYLSDLLYGPAPRAIRDAFRLGQILRSADSLSIIGADIMDGAYNWRSSSRRAVIAALVAKNGIDTRILGFSWNGKPHPVAMRNLRGAATAGVGLYARDPISERRLIEAAVPNVHSSADIVFASRGMTVFDAVAAIERPIALVNASALVAKSVSQTRSYVSLVKLLVSLGYHAILLPHVFGETPSRGDAAEIALIASELPDDVRTHTTHVRDQLTPDTVRSLAGTATLVITGRMHLSVMALASGTPAVVIGTQGKVEGLLQRFQITDLLVRPDEIADGGLERAALRVHNSLDEYSRLIEMNLPSVQKLAAVNFRGLRS